MGFTIKNGILTNYEDEVGVKEVHIPKEVERIGQEAFLRSNIERVILPDGLIGIDSMAFRECTSLRTIMLPDRLNYIGAQAFLPVLNLKR